MRNALWTLILASASVLQAHHGWAAFDTKAVVTLEGIVTDFHFVNPHSIVEFDVRDDQGQVRKWQGELTSPGHLTPRGWTRNSIENGDHITVAGYAAKNNAPSLWVTRIVLSNGQELKLDGGN
jgi:hypothetical protein